MVKRILVMVNRIFQIQTIHSDIYRALITHQLSYRSYLSIILRQLISSTLLQLSVPRTRLNLSKPKRAFSVASPRIWNELPTTLKSSESLSSFRNNFKTSFQNSISILIPRRSHFLTTTFTCPFLLRFMILVSYAFVLRPPWRYRSY